jgi:hypothetical protein
MLAASVLGVASSASNALILAAQRSYSKPRRADARRSLLQARYPVIVCRIAPASATAEARRVDARRFCLGVASSASNALILAAQRSYSKPRRADARRSWEHAIVHRECRFFSAPTSCIRSGWRKPAVVREPDVRCRCNPSAKTGRRCQRDS